MGDALCHDTGQANCIVLEFPWYVALSRSGIVPAQALFHRAKSPLVGFTSLLPCDSAHGGATGAGHGQGQGRESDSLANDRFEICQPFEDVDILLKADGVSRPVRRRGCLVVPLLDKDGVVQM